MKKDAVIWGDPNMPVLGSTVGPWLLEERIDSGSYGRVYLARLASQPESPPVAVKMAKKPWDPRFERESEVLRRVRHPSVPGFVDAGEWVAPNENSYPYMAMELIRGFTLYNWIRQQPRTNQQVLEVLAQVARGLEAVHATGVIHRDVKGDNIRVTAEGRAVLLDFGSCWLPEARPLTDSCAPPGTSVYRAPELLRFMWKHRLDDEARWDSEPCDDLYSLGVTAYRLVTGSYPPPVSETGDLRGEPRKLRRPCDMATVLPELEALILRLLSEDRQERGTTPEVAEALEQLAQQKLPGAERAVLPTLAAAHTEKGAPTLPSSERRRATKPSRKPPSETPERRAVRVPFPGWVSSGITAVIGSVVAVYLLEMRHEFRSFAPSAPEAPAPWDPPVAWHSPTIDAPDAGVGEEVLASAQDTPRVAVPAYALGRPMPKLPFIGQRKPPCEGDGQRALNGGCWFGPNAALKPPCGKSAFEHEDGCYLPVFDAPPQPTSGQP